MRFCNVDQRGAQAYVAVQPARPFTHAIALSRRVCVQSFRAPRLLHAGKQSTVATPEPHSLSELPLPGGPPESYDLDGDETTYILKKGWLPFWQERSAAYGPVFRTKYTGKVAYMIADFPTIERATYADHKFTRVDMPLAWEQLIDSRAFMMDRETNQAMRRKTAQAFGPKAMQSYAQELEAIMQPGLQRALLNRKIDLHDFVTKETVEFATRLVCGLHLEQPEAKEAIRKDLPLLLWGAYAEQPKLDLPGLPFHAALQARKQLDEVLRPVVAARKAKLLENALDKGGDKNFMSQLLLAKAQVGLQDVTDDKTLLDMVVFVLVAGYDTSKTALMGLLAILALAPPRVLEQLRAEQRAVVAKHGERLSRDALANMKYAYSFAKEALRVFNTNVIGTRLVIADLRRTGGEFRRAPCSS